MIDIMKTIVITIMNSLWMDLVSISPIIIQMKSLINAMFFYALITMAFFYQCTQGCFQCHSSTRQCTACLQKYDLTILGECVKGTIENCNLYLNSTYCLSCSPTYYVDNNLCIKDESGCYKNITDKRCGACTPELTLLNGTCTGVFNCINYTNRCIQCDQGFTLLENTCIANRENCKIVNRLSGVCIKCQDNYRLIGYNCISNVYYNPNCQLYNNKGKCFLCKEGFTLYQNNCFGKKQLLLIQELQDQYANKSVNSSTQTRTTPKNKRENTSFSNTNLSNNYCNTFENSKCIKCFTNFHLKQGECYYNNPLCRQIYPNGSCKSCYQGYFLQVGDCILAKNDNLGQSIAAINKVVAKLKQQADPNCQNYSSGFCAKCNSGYYLNNKNTCSKKYQNCLSYNDATGVCRVCISPYVLINSQCIYAVSNCLLYDMNNDCFQCSLGFYLKDKVCYPNDVTCARYDMIGSCIECVQTYYLVNRQCVFPSLGYDPYCLSYTNSYCTLCLIGYYLQSYRCAQVDPNCAAFDYMNGVCIGCLGSLNARGATCI